ncbi:MAG: hypothetical protein FWD08_00210 [Alphaproteobacteria bacterium]|nr:hypothetical protein [Alphaproteobacteria bacterium]
MKAITLWQPWASLVAIGAKPYEFRGWAPPRAIIGQRIAIHAGARKVRHTEVAWIVRSARRTAVRADVAGEWLAKVAVEPSLAVLSHVVCTAVLGEPIRGDKVMSEFGVPVENDSNRPFTFNWAWPMLDIELLVPPVHARGAQGFWDWTP